MCHSYNDTESSYNFMWVWIKMFVDWKKKTVNINWTFVVRANTQSTTKREKQKKAIITDTENAKKHTKKNQA